MMARDLGEFPKFPHTSEKQKSAATGDYANAALFVSIEPERRGG
jgi:hypothetical protein